MKIFILFAKLQNSARKLQLETLELKPGLMKILCKYAYLLHLKYVLMFIYILEIFYCLLFKGGLKAKFHIYQVLVSVFHFDVLVCQKKNFSI